MVGDSAYCISASNLRIAFRAPKYCTIHRHLAAREIYSTVFPKDFISGYSKQDVWARGEGCLTGIFGPNRTYKGYFCWLVGLSVPWSLPSGTSSELHKLSKIKTFRSALRAEMFVSQERRRATQTFENQKKFALRFAPEGYAHEQGRYI